MTICTISPDGEGTPRIDLQAYIEHKIGHTIQEIEADSHERFLVIEAEALRDIVVMAEVTGQGACVVPCPGTLQNADCKRIIEAHCKLV